MPFYDPAAFAANQAKARQYAMSYGDDEFFMDHYGLTRAQFIAANYLDPVTLVSLPFPTEVAFPGTPLPYPTVSTNPTPTGPTSNITPVVSGPLPPVAAPTSTLTWLAVAAGIWYAGKKVFHWF